MSWGAVAAIGASVIGGALSGKANSSAGGGGSGSSSTTYPAQYGPTATGYNESIPIYNQTTQALDSLFGNAAKQIYTNFDPDMQAGYSALDKYLDSMGIARPTAGSYQAALDDSNGGTQYSGQAMTTPGQGSDSMQSILESDPGYQYTLSQALKATQRTGQSAGLVGTPAVQQALMKQAQGMAASQLSDYRTNLMGLITNGTNATSSMGSLAGAMTNLQGQALSQGGNNVATAVQNASNQWNYGSKPINTSTGNTAGTAAVNNTGVGAGLGLMQGLGQTNPNTGTSYLSSIFGSK